MSYVCQGRVVTFVSGLTNGVGVRTLVQLAAVGDDVCRKSRLLVQTVSLYLRSLQPGAVSRVRSDGNWKF